MTQRQLDLALLAGIGVLLLVILGLALSPAPTVAGDISDPAVRAQQAAAPNGQPATGDRAAGDRAAGEPEAPAQDTPAQTTPAENSEAEVATLPPVADNADVGNVPLEQASAQTDPTAEAATRPAEVPTEGVPVERVGFAYATGSEGACGVPLTAWNYVAVSRDLLEAYPCGTAVTLTFEDAVAGRTSVTAQVGDTMGAEITDTVNVFVGEAEPALEYGVTNGTLAQ